MIYQPNLPSMTITFKEYENSGKEDFNSRSQLKNVLLFLGISSLATIDHVLCEAEKEENLESSQSKTSDLKENVGIDDDYGFILGYVTEPKGGKLTKKQAIERSKELLKRRMEEVGAPGLSIHVTVDGEDAWADGDE